MKNLIILGDLWYWGVQVIDFFKLKGMVQKSVVNFFWVKTLVVIPVSIIKNHILTEFLISFHVSIALISQKPNKPCCNLMQI